MPKGYVVTVGSDSGREMISKNRTNFKKAEAQILDTKYKKRDKLISEIREKAEKYFRIDQTNYRNIEKEINAYDWNNEVDGCVECGACNLVCSTCHCFILSDLKEKPLQRYKKWDACLYASFAKVAGGANPRKFRAERLKNRFEKKFAFFPEVLGLNACSGCGRCITACPAKIDIREVVKRLSKGKEEK